MKVLASILLFCVSAFPQTLSNATLSNAWLSFQNGGGGGAPLWSLLQYQQFGGCQNSWGVKCSLTISSTTAGSVMNVVSRCASAILSNECSVLTAKTYSGSADASGGCSGSLVDTFTIVGNVQKDFHNAGIATMGGGAGGANCIALTRDTTALDGWLFFFYEHSPGSGGSLALDTSSMTAVNVGSSCGTNCYNYSSSAPTLTGRNDLVVASCICGGDPGSVSPSAWTTNYKTAQHSAVSWQVNISNSGMSTPIWQQINESVTSGGIISYVAYTN